MHKELEKLDLKAAEICPENILQMDGIILSAKKEPKPPANPPPAATKIKRREFQLKTRPVSDLGDIDQNGQVAIAPDHQRPLYPWETQAGMLWIKSL